jgi:L-ascorbate metabolism protein UlaG (beta-lactamase superfamily)
MRLTFHGHSCVTLDNGGTRLTLDPGTFADAPTALRGSDAALVTHAHPDHLDAAALRDARAERPGLRVFGPQSVFDRLEEEPDDDRLVLVEPGDVLSIGPFSVLVGGGQHALIYPDIPRVTNATYLVAADGARVYHPGDSFSTPLTDHRLDVLLTPVAAPWLKIAEAIDFIRALDPWTLVPVHEGVLSANGLGLVHRLLDEGRTGGIYAFRPLASGESLDVHPRDEDRTGRPDPQAVAEEIRQAHPEYDEAPALEYDETVPPRPEEEVADATRE